MKKEIWDERRKDIYISSDYIGDYCHVQMLHAPTGIKVEGDTKRSVHQLREMLFKELNEKIDETLA